MYHEKRDEAASVRALGTAVYHKNNIVSAATNVRSVVVWVRMIRESAEPGET